jgi:hypothetical protein
LDIVLPLETGVSGNDDYQPPYERRETLLQGTDSLGSLPIGDDALFDLTVLAVGLDDADVFVDGPA